MRVRGYRERAAAAGAAATGGPGCRAPSRFIADHRAQSHDSSDSPVCAHLLASLRPRSGLASTPASGSAAARSSSSARSRPIARVARPRGRAPEFHARLVVAAEPREQIAAHTRQPRVAGQRGIARERIDERKPRRRPARHAHRDREIERDLREYIVDCDDRRPVGVGRRARPRVAGGKRGLQRVGAMRAAQRLRARARRARAGSAAGPNGCGPGRAAAPGDKDQRNRGADSRHPGRMASPRISLFASFIMATRSRESSSIVSIPTP